MRDLIFLFSAFIFLGPNGFAQAKIHRVDFKNFTYQPYCVGDEPHQITVKNGESIEDKQRDGYVDHMYFEIRGIKYGDLNADGKDEAIIITNCNTGGTGQFTEGFVYTTKSGKPILLARIPGGDRAYGGLRDARVENGLLIVESNDVGEEGGACCPEFVITSKYKVVNGKLNETAAAFKRPIYPPQRIAFARGTSASMITLTIRPSEGKRLVVGARGGQTLSVALSTDTVDADLVGDAEVAQTKNGFTAKLPKNGDYTIQLTNRSETVQTVVTTITIR